MALFEDKEPGRLKRKLLEEITRAEEMKKQISDPNTRFGLDSQIREAQRQLDLLK